MPFHKLFTKVSFKRRLLLLLYKLTKSLSLTAFTLVRTRLTDERKDGRTYTQTDRHTHRQTDRQTYSHFNKDIVNETDTKNEIEMRYIL